jgi:hypothetical protein
VVEKEIFFLFKFVGILGCLCQQQQQPQSMPTLSRRGRLELFGSPFRQPHGKGAAMAEVFERNSTTTTVAATLSFFRWLVGWLVPAERERAKVCRQPFFHFQTNVGPWKTKRNKSKSKSARNSSSFSQFSRFLPQ